VLTFGLIEYGWMFLRAQEISNAARQGARRGATPASGNADVQGAVDNVMTTASLDGSGYTITISPATDGLATGTEFTVTVAVPYDNIRLLNLPLIPTPTTLRGSTTMNKEGP
jgi:Flp pilus assembly protein TadG